MYTWYPAVTTRKNVVHLGVHVVDIDFTANGYDYVWLVCFRVSFHQPCPGCPSHRKGKLPRPRGSLRPRTHPGALVPQPATTGRCYTRTAQAVDIQCLWVHSKDEDTDSERFSLTTPSGPRVQINTSAANRATWHPQRLRITVTMCALIRQQMHAAATRYSYSYSARIEVEVNQKTPYESRVTRCVSCTYDLVPGCCLLHPDFVHPYFEFDFP